MKYKYLEPTTIFEIFFDKKNDFQKQFIKKVTTGVLARSKGSQCIYVAFSTPTSINFYIIKNQVPVNSPPLKDNQSITWTLSLSEPDKWLAFSEVGIILIEKCYRYRHIVNVKNKLSEIINEAKISSRKSLKIIDCFTMIYQESKRGHNVKI